VCFAAIAEDMEHESEIQARKHIIDVIRAIKEKAELSNWPPAVRAAPEAIKIMAVCLRAASNPEAKAIDVGQGFVDLDGQRITFPLVFNPFPALPPI
jgi:hypothetical protein